MRFSRHAWREMLLKLLCPLDSLRSAVRRGQRLLKRAGFAIRELDSGYLKGPRPMTYVYRGWAEAG